MRWNDRKGTDRTTTMRAASAFLPVIPATALALAASCLCAAPATAHPHSWIDLRSEAVFDGEGRLAALHETWLFDEYYTTFVFEHAMKGKNSKGKPTQADIDTLTRKNIKNLTPYGYFTRIHADGNILATSPAEEVNAALLGNRLEMRFTLTLASPQPVMGHAVFYAIFDPTYFIEMLHAETPGAIRLTGAPENCSHTVTPPSPTVEDVIRASKLDPTQSAGDTLGEVFAEKVEIVCK